MAPPIEKEKSMSNALVNTGRTSVPNRVVSNEQKRELAKKLKHQRDKERELVRGVFHYYEVPNGVLEFSYKKFREDPVETYQLFDGQIYSLPLGVAKHLNQNIAYPQYEYIKGEEVIGGYNSGYGSTPAMGMRIKSKVKRCSFQSLEFLDVDELEMNPQRIVEVDQVLMNG